MGRPLKSIAAIDAELTGAGAPFETEVRIIAGRQTRVWKNAPATLCDILWLGRTFGQATFIIHGEERITFDAFVRASVTFATALSALGVGKGDRVAIAARNLPEWAVAFFACSLNGAIATLLNAWWTGPELAFGVRDSGAKVLIADGERLERLRDQFRSSDAPFTIGVRTADDGAHSMESILGDVDNWAALKDSPAPEVTLGPEDDATILYTSGTTGTPKGALATHRAVITTLMTGAFIGARSALRDPAPAPELKEQRAILLSVPLFHAVGCFGTLTSALAGGCKLVMMSKWDVEEGMRLIERERITDAGGVPTTAMQLLDAPGRERYNLSSLRSISYGGAPSKPEMVSDLKLALPNATPMTGWGMTETSGGVIAQLAGDVSKRPKSCGVPIPVWDVRVVDDAGEVCAPHKVGELQVKGPGLIKTYWNNADAYTATLDGEWLKSGDLAYADDDGFYYIADRIKDVIIRGGENIYSVAVENTLCQHPAVSEAAVVGVPHRVLGEEPVAIVHLRVADAVSERELRDFAAGRIAAFAVPVRIVFVPDSLPRNAAGKILKAQLKADLT